MTIEPKKNTPKSNWSYYMKFSGMGLQMGAVIFLGTYLGIKLDEWTGTKKFPVFTLVFALLSVFGAIYMVIREFIKK